MELSKKAMLGQKTIFCYNFRLCNGSSGYLQDFHHGSHRFDFTAVRVRFLAVKVAQGQVFLDVLLFFLVNIISQFSFSSTCFPYHKKKERSLENLPKNNGLLEI